MDFMVFCKSVPNTKNFIFHNTLHFVWMTVIISVNSQFKSFRTLTCNELKLKEKRHTDEFNEPSLNIFSVSLSSSQSLTLSPSLCFSLPL